LAGRGLIEETRNPILPEMAEFWLSHFHLEHGIISSFAPPTAPQILSLKIKRIMAIGETWVDCTLGQTSLRFY
jgi:hypothetical protein